MLLWLSDPQFNKDLTVVYCCVLGLCLLPLQLCSYRSVCLSDRFPAAPWYLGEPASSRVFETWTHWSWVSMSSTSGLCPSQWLVLDAFVYLKKIPL